MKDLEGIQQTKQKGGQKNASNLLSCAKKYYNFQSFCLNKQNYVGAFAQERCRDRTENDE